MGLPPLPDTPEASIQLQSPGQAPVLVSAAQLKAMAASGQLSPDSQVWFAGLPNWVRAIEYFSSGAKARDDEQDRIFGELVKSSWKYFKEHELAGHIDEVFVGALITSSLDSGYSLIDLSSDGSHHFLRFENLSDHSRIVLQLTHLTHDLVTAKVLGQHVSLLVGYGERMGDFGKIWQALKAEFKSGFVANPEPGTITVDGDVSSGYVYVQVDLYLPIEPYVSNDYTINYARLARDLGATFNALKKYLRGRFQS